MESKQRKKQFTIKEQNLINEKVRTFSDSAERHFSLYGNLPKRVKDIHERRRAYHDYLMKYEGVDEGALSQVKDPNSVSVITAVLLKKKRAEMLERFQVMGNLDSSEVFEALAEMEIMAKSVMKEDAQILLSDVVHEYHISEADLKGRRKTYSDIKAEIDFSSHTKIWEGNLGKAVLSGLAVKMRNKMSSAKNDAEKFKALADLIILSAMFNFDTVKDVMKQMKAA